MTVVTAAVHVVKAAAHTRIQSVCYSARQCLPAATPMRLSLLAREADAAVIDHICPPESFLQKAREICLVGAPQGALHNICHTLLGQPDESIGGVLEGPNLRPVVKEGSEDPCVRTNHGSRLSHWPFYPTPALALSGFSSGPRVVAESSMANYRSYYALRGTMKHENDPDLPLRAHACRRHAHGEGREVGFEWMPRGCTTVGSKYL